MECLRCRRETEEGHAFCPDCLSKMAKYPVEPNTVIHLPRRRAAVPVKKPTRRRSISAEERIARLEKRIRRMTIALFFWVALALILAAVVYYLYSGSTYVVGQEYKTPSTITQPTTTATIPVGENS